MNHQMKKEEGFWSIMFILFLTTLASLAMATFHSSRQTQISALNQANMVRADCAATSGAYIGIIQVQQGYSDSSFAFQMEEQVGVSIRNYTIASTSGGDTILVESSATVENTLKQVRIRLFVPIFNLADYGIVTEGDVGARVNVYDWPDSTTPNPDRLVTHCESFPEIDEGALEALALSQNTNGYNHYYSSSVSVSYHDVRFPTEFWADEAAGIPNVIYVEGGFNMSSWSEIGGIIVVVGGDVVVNPHTQVNGVVYIATDNYFNRGNDATIIDEEGDFSTIGGIVSRGGVYASSVNSKHHVNVNYEDDYMSVFAQFQTGGGGGDPITLSWEYF